MPFDVETMKAEYEQAEAEAHSIQAERDDALQALRDTYDQRLQDAVDAAAEKQSEWMDAEAANALAARVVTEDRPLEGDEVTQEYADGKAAELGLTLPDE